MDKNRYLFLGKSAGFALFILALSYGVFQFYHSISGVKVGGDFTLNLRGQPWRFAQNARPLNLLYIGYVNCPDVCPMSLSQVGQAIAGLSAAERSKVQPIFISVDAAHDTPQSVADYAAQFSSDFIGLTGSASEIKKAINLFQASFIVDQTPKTYLGYSISHTDRLFFLNKKGFVMDSISNPRSAPEILKKIKEQL